MRNGHKYGAVKTVVDNITFASKAEAKRYGELKMLEKAGVVQRLELQPKYDLYAYDISISARLKEAASRLRGVNTSKKRMVKIGTYIADFRYQLKGLSASENDRWHDIVEDVKGMKTPMYRWKKKHVEAQYGITITEITR